MTKWLKVMLIVAVAVSLPFVVFEKRAEQARCGFDVCTPDWSKGLLLPDHVVAIVKADRRVIEERQVPSNTIFRDAYLGIYVREGIPFVVGYLLGLAVPILLLGYAVVLIVRSPRLTASISATT
jgi:hypothetical protein